MNAVHLTRDGEIAVLTVDNPPVNALGVAVRRGLFDALAQALADEGVRAIVLIGARVFMAGADIKEFGRPPEPPTLPDVIAALDAADKPVIAAIAGAALGGGLETALACRYRLAAPAARVGLPEVNLGLLPGAGGTQRLPRLVGPDTAIELMTTGRHLPAAQALQLGLVDEIVEGDLLAGALHFARNRALAGDPPPRVSARADKLAGVDPALFDGWRQKMASRWRGQVAPFRIVDCVEAACRLPFDQGLAYERDAFQDCLESPARAAMVHLFFAERAAQKIAGVGPEVKGRPIRYAAVIGAGTMGGGIAMSFANAGVSVKVLDTSPEALERGMAVVRRNYANSVARGSTPQEKADAALDRIEAVGDYSDIADADIVVEAVFESMEVKKEVFAKLDAVMQPGAILASNTSTLSITEIATATARPEDVVGTHFFSPANVMKLQENVRGARSSPETLATVTALAKTLGKVAVMSGDAYGFIGNRILHAYGREADFLLEEGAGPEQIDRALMAFGFPMGVYRMRDLAGLDVGWRIRQSLEPTRDKTLRYSRIADVLAQEGRYGQKTGAGYYRYETGDRTPHPDPHTSDVIARLSAEAGRPQRAWSDEEIVERILSAAANEGARILGDGVAQRAGDIDVVYAYGYGFPRWQGGPMFWAERRGLDHLLAYAQRMHAQEGAFWAPAPLLVERARAGGGWA